MLLDNNGDSPPQISLMILALVGRQLRVRSLISVMMSVQKLGPIIFFAIFQVKVNLSLLSFYSACLAYIVLTFLNSRSIL